MRMALGPILLLSSLEGGGTCSSSFPHSLIPSFPHSLIPSFKHPIALSQPRIRQIHGGRAERFVDRHADGGQRSVVSNDPAPEYPSMEELRILHRLGQAVHNVAADILTGEVLCPLGGGARTNDRSDSAACG